MRSDFKQFPIEMQIQLKRDIQNDIFIFFSVFGGGSSFHFNNHQYSRERERESEKPICKTTYFLWTNLIRQTKTRNRGNKYESMEREQKSLMFFFLLVCLRKISNTFSLPLHKYNLHSNSRYLLLFSFTFSSVSCNKRKTTTNYN